MAGPIRIPRHRIAVRIAALARRRLALRQDYTKARRNHRGAARAATALRETTHALLRQELHAAKAAPLKRDAREREAMAPNLFEEMAT
ncbi:hypothetical protein C3941_23625 [Kaistia algarum]|uniref:hypothetical protein n=1 Tax=Kaistia algarum TaxID=2083279 RepID=UPI000CE8F01D|nr:hypothetical protein [Kaistia algarum]MCX5513452.1 hypothetical protein [Kaistia algarum]PPE77450.1 hypothetical protein C3941_23625 [Kaistia algarum]